jgi:hypothetical protein
VQVECKAQKAWTLDAIHTPFDDGLSIGRKQSLVECALEMIFIVSACIGLAQFNHLETVVNLINHRLNQDQVLEMYFSGLV